MLTTPDTARQLMVQYWSLDMQTDLLIGVLSDSHRDLAAVTNFLWDDTELVPCRTGLPSVMPFSLAEGASLTGMLDATSMDLDLTAQTTDASRIITARLVGTRTPLDGSAPRGGQARHCAHSPLEMRSPRRAPAVSRAHQSRVRTSTSSVNVATAPPNEPETNPSTTMSVSMIDA